jgi:hypothetical protein
MMTTQFWTVGQLPVSRLSGTDAESYGRNFMSVPILVAFAVPLEDKQLPTS